MSALDTQVWLPVKDYETKYEVSNLGNVRTLEHTHITRNRWGEMERKVPSKTLSGSTSERYIRVCLEGNMKSVHVLVAEAFIQNPDNLPEVNHIDEDKHNNVLANLEWISRVGNAIHSMGLPYHVVNTEGLIIKGKGIALFCREYGLNRNSFTKLIKGEIDEYRNWKRA